jgi:uncharacterized protein (TIGR02147 family)
MNTQCFATFLRFTLLEKIQKNSQYSLRSFARHLEIEPSQLSKILNKKRSPTENLILKLGKKLNLNQIQCAAYVEWQEQHQVAIGQKKSPNNRKYKQIELDFFSIFSEWYHFAILELLQVKSIRPSVKLYAKTLGLENKTVNLALRRMVNCEYLLITAKGEWVDNSENATTINFPGTTHALRNLQSQIIEKAKDSLNNDPIQKRDQSSITLAIHSSQLEHAKEKIKQFRRELGEILQAKQPFDQVYNLSVSLYPLTHLEDSHD